MHSIRDLDLYDIVNPIDTVHRSGPFERPVRFHVRRLTKRVQRIAQALMASIGVVICTIVLVLSLTLVFWIASADSESAGYAASPAWSPTSTILIDRDR